MTTHKGTLGAILAAERTRRDMELDDVAAQTGLSETTITAFELGEYENLSHDVYTTGQLRTYVDFLGLDLDRMIQLYDAERGSAAHSSPAASTKRHRRVRAPIVTSRLLVQAVAGVLLLAAVGYILFQVVLLTSAPQLVVVFPRENQTVYSETVEVVGTTTPGSEVVIDNTPIGVSADGSFRFTLTLPEGVHTIHLEAHSELGRTSRLNRTIIVAPPGTVPN